MLTPFIFNLIFLLSLIYCQIFIFEKISENNIFFHLIKLENLYQLFLIAILFLMVNHNIE